MKKVLVAIAILVAIVMAIWLWPRSRRTHTKDARTSDDLSDSPRTTRTSKAVPSASAPVSTRTPPGLDPAPPLTPIIDSITVEKPRVCSGEENLVTVKAHTPEGKEDG